MFNKKDFVSLNIYIFKQGKIINEQGTVLT